MIFSDNLNKLVDNAVKSYDGSYNSEGVFDELVSMGELVDRLSIVNFKLYTLKDKVAVSKKKNFKAWAATEDIKLVMERSRLKQAIDKKLIQMIDGALNKEASQYFIPEVKRYGDEYRS